VLIDPFEEQFHQPATFVKSGSGQRRQVRVVGWSRGLKLGNYTKKGKEFQIGTKLN
jgi:hypothetical protein